MNRSLALVLPLPFLLLSACEPLESECYGTWAGFDMNVERPTDASGLAVRSKDLTGKPNADTIKKVMAWVKVSNESVEEDCVVALYATTDTPDPSALPDLDPETSPPSEIEGLGELIGAVNLSANRTDWPDYEEFLVELPTVESGEQLSIVVATCAHGEVVAEFEVEAKVCSDWEDEPNLNDIYDRLW